MMRVPALALGLLLAAPVFAQETAPKPAASYPEWEKLSPEQRKALVDPVRARWNDNPDMREQMFKRAQHWQNMTPEERQAAQRGMRRWENLTPEQRQAMHEQWKTMTPEQKKAWKESGAMPKPQAMPKSMPKMPAPHRSGGAGPMGGHHH